jgi:hypothetical protein
VIIPEAALLQIVSLQGFWVVSAPRKEQSEHKSTFLQRPTIRFNPPLQTIIPVQHLYKKHSKIAVQTNWNVVKHKDSEEKSDQTQAEKWTSCKLKKPYNSTPANLPNLTR